MAYIGKLFGSSYVMDKSGRKVNLEKHCAGKTVCFFFSACWCPACREFTPVLAKFYKNFKTSKNFEIIFISGDLDSRSFQEYYNEMPFLALNFKDEDKRQEVSEAFKVEGIPRVVIINADNGEVYTNEGRIHIQNTDKNGEKFPWKF